MKRFYIVSLVVFWLMPLTATPADYMSRDTFVAHAFAGQASSPALAKLWLTKNRKGVVAQILGHDYPEIRLRYWVLNQRTVWILDEIGKEQPITVGVVVDQAGIQQVEILAFRESRGWEVRYPFFTEQFNGAQLTGQLGLNTSVDGITGATLSVKAVTRVARLALYLHCQAMNAEGCPW